MARVHAWQSYRNCFASIPSQDSRHRQAKVAVQGQCYEVLASRKRWPQPSLVSPTSVPSSSSRQMPPVNPRLHVSRSRFGVSTLNLVHPSRLGRSIPTPLRPFEAPRPLLRLSDVPGELSPVANAPVTPVLLKCYGARRSVHPQGRLRRQWVVKNVGTVRLFAPGTGTRRLTGRLGRGPLSIARPVDCPGQVVTRRGLTPPDAG